MPSRLSQTLHSAQILLGSPARNADQVLSELAGLLATGDDEQARFTAALKSREQTGSTALGNGVAVPHARIAGLDRIRAAFLRSAVPLPFHAPDGLPVSVFFGLLVPEHANTEHLELLADIADLLSDESAIEVLRRTHSPATIIATMFDAKAQ